VKKRKKPPTSKLEHRKSTEAALPAGLLDDVRALINQARDATARAVNSAIVLLYWRVGDRIRRETLREKRAEYGKQILGTLSQESAVQYGQGFTYDNLTRRNKGVRNHS
jgi:hypothetical protein